MSLAKWVAKNLKGKGAKLGEKIGPVVAKARGGIEGLLDAVEDAGPDLLKAGGNIARGVMSAHPGKSAAGLGGTGALLGALGMKAADDDDDEDDGTKKSDLKERYGRDDDDYEKPRRKRSKRGSLQIYVDYSKNLDPKKYGFG